MDKTFHAARVPLHDQIRDYLRELIAAGDLNPGEALPPERELASQLGVSRHSLRQALASLSAIGLVETKHGSGVYLTSTPSDAVVARFADALFKVNHSIGDAVEARLAFEPFVAHRAAECRTDEDLALLAMSVEVPPQESANDGTVREALTFHHQLARTTGNPIFAGLLRSVTTGPRNITRLAKHTPNSAARWRGEHLAILKAVQAGNGARAQRLMAAHLAPMIEIARSLENRKRRTT
ncbi:MAG: GntR family transcriptional regulator [Allobranchiibius sp.]